MHQIRATSPPFREGARRILILPRQTLLRSKMQSRWFPAASHSSRSSIVIDRASRRQASLKTCCDACLIGTLGARRMKICLPNFRSRRRSLVAPFWFPCERSQGTRRTGPASSSLERRGDLPTRSFSRVETSGLLWPRVLAIGECSSFDSGARLRMFEATGQMTGRGFATNLALASIPYHLSS